MSVSFASGTVPTKTDPRWTLLAKILLALANVGSAVSTNGQLVVYESTDPTTEGLTPTNQNAPAWAYKRDGTGPSYSWNPTTHVWS